MDEQVDILISRVVDGVATPQDWRALEVEAAKDPSIWQELALSQREQQMLTRAASDLIARADRVELPKVPAVREHSAGEQQTILSLRARTAATWGGWAAAAAIALAFVMQQPAGTPPSTTGTASLGSPIGSAADALSEYMKRGRQDGRVLGEMPDKVLVDTVPAADGDGYEVIYLRQIVERQRVPGLHQVTTNELGQPTALPVNIRLRVKPAM